MMKIYFRQIYIEAGVSFPFSHLFQRRLSEEVTALSGSSPLFSKKYGKDWKLIFNVSAKSALRTTDVRGPAVSRKDEDVEYTIFLPFSVIHETTDVSRTAIGFLFDAFLSVLATLEFSTAEVEARRAELIESICSDSGMFRCD